ncbi:hypothetical protein [Priestia endophytica]|uniref:hypothetical protein n=1 Tax=Priestia endophytica TaxID=135735 RepID=UPI000F51DFF0|nr:hypothetical protein [Priestia endophytica]RPK04739.1 hypothetical protein FH5_01977 [Priestia endophytica]
MSINKKRSNAFLIIIGILFIFSICSLIFSFDSRVDDVVYCVGFLIAIILAIFYRKKEHKNPNSNTKDK